MIRAVVADREIAVRLALRLLLTHELSFRIVREAATTDGLRRQIQRVHPDILVVDWSLIESGPDGLISILRGLCPDLRVLALHIHPEVREVALASGADGFVSKGEGPDQVVRTVCKPSVAPREPVRSMRSVPDSFHNTRSIRRYQLTQPATQGQRI